MVLETKILLQRHKWQRKGIAQPKENEQEGIVDTDLVNPAVIR